MEASPTAQTPELVPEVGSSWKRMCNLGKETGITKKDTKISIHYLTSWFQGYHRLTSEIQDVKNFRVEKNIRDNLLKIANFADKVTETTESEKFGQS